MPLLPSYCAGTWWPRSWSHLPAAATNGFPHWTYLTRFLPCFRVQSPILVQSTYSARCLHWHSANSCSALEPPYITWVHHGWTFWASTPSAWRPLLDLPYCVLAIGFHLGELVFSLTKVSWRHSPSPSWLLVIWPPHMQRLLAVCVVVIMTDHVWLSAAAALPFDQRHAGLLCESEA